VTGDNNNLTTVPKKQPMYYPDHENLIKLSNLNTYIFNLWVSELLKQFLAP